MLHKSLFIQACLEHQRSKS